MDRSESSRGHGPSSSATTLTVTFDYTGKPQSWTVPAGVNEATFTVNGGAGGLDIQNAAGLGGQAVATLAVTAGAVYTIVVGGAGESIRQALPGRSGGRGGYGYGPGGEGGAPFDTNTAIPGAGGGGGSAVLLGNDVLLIGGGAGGSSNNPAAGGAGGGTQGSPGHANTDPNFVWDGQPGTQAKPGAGGVGITASHGGPGVGHAGGAGGAGGAENGGGGGGGGGWFGGGGGASGDLCSGAGGGASGYAATGISATLTAGVHTGNGQVTITYPTPSRHPTHTRPVGHTDQPSERPSPGGPPRRP